MSRSRVAKALLLELRIRGRELSIVELAGVQGGDTAKSGG